MDSVTVFIGVMIVVGIIFIIIDKITSKNHN